MRVRRRDRSSRVTKGKYIRGGLVLLVITAVTLVGVSQLQVVRDFLSKASGEPANILIDTQAVIGPMPRPWRNLAQGGEEASWRPQPVSSQVKNLHPEYIRLDHIYDFYEIVQGSPGNLTFDFTKFDQVLNDIQAAGATPYLALSYMPPAISRGDIVDQPVNWADWQLVVQRTIEHVSGTRNMADVYYEVWNEPDLFGGWKYYGAKNYLTLYHYAAIGASQARVKQAFKIGGPATTGLYRNWFDALLKYAIDHRLRLDFFTWHRYSHDIDQYRDDMFNARQWLQAYPQLQPTLELHITEWGHDSDNHSGYDNNYGAAHTVAGAIEMIGVVDRAFVFEIQDGKDANGQVYWGRWGLLTHADYGSQPKPRFRALQLLDQIANQRLQLLGKGSWVKAVAARDEEGNTEVVLANFDRRGRHHEVVPITFTNIEPGSYTFSQRFLTGQRQQVQVATTAAELKVTVSLTPNNVVFAELSKQP